MKISSTKSVCRHVKVCVYGESGVGKTVLGSTAPRPLIISAERGLLSLAHLDIPVIEVDSFQAIQEAYRYCKDNKDYDTIVLDSLSEVGETLLTKLKESEKDPRKAYGIMADQLYALTRQFRDIDNHVLFIAKQELNKDELTGKITYRPSAPGQSFTASIPYLFDIVLCMRIGKVDKELVRYLQTQPDLQYQAKDRSGRLAKSEEPDLTKLFNKILGD